MQGIELAFRTLSKSPFVTTVAALSLALGIGANAAIFSLFDQVLLRSLPVQEPERLVNFDAPGPNPGSQSCNQAGGCSQVLSYSMFRDLERAGAGFAGIAAHRLFGANLAFGNQTVSGEGMLVSGSYFTVLGLRPALGRLLTEADDERVGAHYVTVLSHSYWENDLGADPGVLNRTIVVNGYPMTIVGVAPRGFEGTTLGSRPRLFVPLTMTGQMIRPWGDGFFDTNRRAYLFYVFARLRDDGSLEQATAEANTVYSSIINDVEAPLQEGMSAQTLERFRAKQLVLEPGPRGQSSVNQEARTPLLLLFGITGFVLLIACANIANLLLARGASRGGEMALRSSLGASRTQLVGQLLTESVLLALFGGVVGVFVARWTLQVISTLVPPEAVASLEFGIQPSIVLFSAALALGTGVLFGLYPALHATRQDLISVLKVNTAQPSASRAAARYRSALVTAQIALSMALLVGAGLFVRSLLNVSRVDLGLQPDNIVQFSISPVLNGYEAERSMEIFQRVEEEVAAIPGVTSVSASLVPVLAGSNWGTDVSVEGFESGPDVDDNSRYSEVGPAYFSTLGIPLVAGREFTDSDVQGAPRVAVVNEAFTRKFNLNGPEAVGKWMSNDGDDDAELDVQIVGVIQDAKYSQVKQETPPLFYLPYRQNDAIGFLSYYVRSGIDPAQVMQAIPGVIARIDPNLPVENLKSLDQQIRENVFMDRMISILSAGFAVLATLLAAVGLYGVLAFTIAQRTREIGLRMALGAGADRVRRMVLKQVAVMTMIGGVIGLVGAFFVGRAAESLLFEIEGSDPVVAALVAALLGAVAFGAGYVPALRASRVDPMVALRYE